MLLEDHHIETSRDAIFDERVLADVQHGSSLPDH
jgi:hypothetical protein